MRSWDGSSGDYAAWVLMGMDGASDGLDGVLHCYKPLWLYAWLLHYVYLFQIYYFCMIDYEWQIMHYYVGLFYVVCKHIIMMH